MTKILIIDDDHLVREAAKALFRAKGYEVVAAENGKSGIAAAEAGQFDVAIVDLFMPGMDGLQVIGALHRVNPNVPIIAASGFMFAGVCPEMPDFEAMVREVGGISTLYKPFRPDTLLQAVENAIGKAA